MSGVKRVVMVCVVVALGFSTALAVTVLAGGGDSNSTCCKTFNCGRTPDLGWNHCGSDTECANISSSFPDCCYCPEPSPHSRPNACT